MTTQTVNIAITVTGANPAAQQIAGIGNAARGAHSSIFNLRNLLLGFSVKSLAGEFIRLADTSTRISNRLDVLTGSQARSNELFNALFKTAQDTRSALEPTIDAYARLERSTVGYNLTGQQLVDITKGINQSFQIFGNTAGEAEAAMVQFTQGLSVGVLRGDELRSVLEQAPRLAKAIADGLNEIPEGAGLAEGFGRVFKDFQTGKISSELLAGSLRELGKEGKLTGEVITKALLTQLDELNEEFLRTTPTIANGFTLIQNEMLKLARSPAVKQISQALGGALTFVADNLGNLLKLIPAVTVALLAMVSPQIIGGINSMTQSFLRMSAALLTNPIFLIAAAIGGIVVAIGYWIDEMDVFGEHIGVFDVLFAVIKNIAEFFGKLVNVFVVGIQTIIGWVLDLNKQFLTFLQSLGLNWADVFDGMVKFVSGAFKAVFSTVSTVFGFIVRGAAYIGGFFAGTIHDIRAAFIIAFDAIASAASGFINLLIDGLNVFKSEADKVKHVDFTLDASEFEKQLLNPLDTAQQAADQMGSIYNKLAADVGAFAEGVGKGVVDQFKGITDGISKDLTNLNNERKALVGDTSANTLGQVAGGKSAEPVGIQLNANDQRRLDSFIDRMNDLREGAESGRDGLRELKRAQEQYDKLVTNPDIASFLKSRSEQEKEFGELRKKYSLQAVDDLTKEHVALTEAAQASLDHYKAQRLLTQALKDGEPATQAQIDALAAVLKTEREIIDVQRDKEAILESLTKKADEYNIKLAATNQLLAEGRLSEAQQKRILEATEVGRGAKEAKNFIADNTLDPQTALDAQLEALQDEYEQRNAFVAEMQQLDLDNYAKYEEQKTELLAIYERQRTEMQMESQRLQYENASTAFGDLAELSKGFVKESSGVYKTLFTISKAFAIADGVIKLNQAIMNASVSLPFPANLAAMAQVASSGLALLSAIKGAAAPQQALADGGWVNGPGGPRDDAVNVAASNGEFMVNAAAAARNADLLEAINSGRFNAGQGGQGMTLNLTQNYSGPMDRDNFRSSGRQLADETARAVDRHIARL